MRKLWWWGFVFGASIPGVVYLTGRFIWKGIERMIRESMPT